MPSLRILLITCSFRDTPSPHHALLEGQGFEIARERGPLTETRMLELAGDFNACLCGDDAITRAMFEKSGAAPANRSGNRGALAEFSLRGHFSRAHRADFIRSSDPGVTLVAFAYPRAVSRSRLRRF